MNYFWRSKIKILGIVGCFWGDEGKGKYIDFLTPKADLIVRFQGGDNAGHTVYLNKTPVKLRLIPSGVLHAKKSCLLAGGMVINPEVLLNELAMLKKLNIIPAILIADNAHVILPYHVEIDQYMETKLGKKHIGTTHRGIGPAYDDKTLRLGIRITDLFDKQHLLGKIQTSLMFKQHMLKNKYNAQKLAEQYFQYGQAIKPWVIDETQYLMAINYQQHKIIFESSQGTMLDINNGTYPYVTSSSPCISAAGVNSGSNPYFIDASLGIVKAYTTRVGSGMFPTEIKDQQLAEQIRAVGNEYGTVTKRPRRIGWLDLVILRYSIQINGIRYIAISLLDVLSGLDKIKLAVAYRYKTQRYTMYQNFFSILHPETLEIEYIELPGWQQSVRFAKKWTDLPKNCQAYLKQIEQLAKVKIAYISVGPNRNETIVIHDLWKTVCPKKQDFLN